MKQVKNDIKAITLMLLVGISLNDYEKKTRYLTNL